MKRCFTFGIHFPLLLGLIVAQQSENPCIKQWQTAGLSRRFSYDQIKWMCNQKLHFQQILRNAPMMDAAEQMTDKQRAYIDFIQHCRNGECHLKFASDQEEQNTQSDPTHDLRCKMRKKNWRPSFCDPSNHPACKNTGSRGQPRFCQAQRGKRELNHENNISFYNNVENMWLQQEQLDLRVKRQGRNGLSTRKEYRALTDEERDILNAAMNSLKKETVDNTNKWDLFTSFHYPEQAPSAHWGPAFLPWHREFLRQFEVALKNENPSFTGLPYWDSTLDYNLPDPRDSIVWTEPFMGNGNGFVKQGAFNSWPTLTPLDGQPNIKNLYRDVGASPFGGLMREDDIKWVLNRTDFGQFSACVDPTFELLHGLPHIYVGGFMQIIKISPNDPIFYLHHTFIDYLWEQFRQRQQSVQQRLNDWAPADKLCDDSHKIDGNMAPFSGLKNRDGLSEEYTRRWYHYDSQPSCPQGDCESAYLWCDTRGIPKCRSKIRRNGNCTGLDGSSVCYQSSCIQGVCTGSLNPLFTVQTPEPVTDNFITINPVVKPQTLAPPYTNRPLPDTVEPVYHTLPPGSYNTKSTESPISPTYPTVFIKTFLIDENGAVTEGSVQVEGVNYKETSNFRPITQFNYPEHPGIVYVEIKDPSKSFVQAKMTAFDKGGRQCRPYCAQGGNYYKDAYVPCSGSIALSSQPEYSNPVPFTSNREAKRFLNADMSMKPSTWKVKAPYISFLCGSETDSKKIQAFADTIKPDLTSSDHVWFHVLVIDGRVPYHRSVPGARIEAQSMDYHGSTYTATLNSDTEFPFYFGVAPIKAQNPAKTGAPVKVGIKAFNPNGNKCVPTCQKQGTTLTKCEGVVTLSADPEVSDVFSFSSDDTMKDYLNWDLTEHPASWKRMISTVQFVC